MSRVVRRWSFVAISLAFVGCGPRYEEVDLPPTILDDCPQLAPVDGEYCDRYQSCQYALSNCAGGYLRATCSGAVWQVTRAGATCSADSGVDTSVDTSVETGACPGSEPVMGASCSGAMRCQYDNLCPLIALKTNAWSCIGGKWSFENTLESPIECPKTQPRDAQACGCAMYLPSKCSYTTSCGSVDAVCDGSTQRWTVSACATADAGTDATPEVSTDATPEASTDAMPEASTDAMPEASTDASASEVALDAPAAEAASDATAD